MSEPRADTEELSYKAFLSHRYKSPELNLYFYELLSVCNVQFTVDVGIKSTNVTRLERAVRGADAFIGLYPYSGEQGVVPSEDELRSLSKYFRLELDLALRIGLPTLVFYDHRLGEILDLPDSIWCEGFDLAEVVGGGGSPEQRKQETLIRRFNEHVRASKAEAASKPSVGRKRQHAGYLLPTGASGYRAHHIEAIRAVVREQGILRLTELPWPPVLNLDFFSKLDEIDWLIVDVAPEALGSGVIGFLHGRGIPMLRLWKGADPAGKTLEAQEHKALFGGVEVGYGKDIVRWKRIEQLRNGLEERMQILLLPSERISTHDEALRYFESAALRKEKVFLSYSGSDEEWGSRFATALLKRFQTVFNYKDGESITVGESWVEQIFDSINDADLAVPLMSPGYLASDNCLHEAQEFVAARDSKKTHLVPVKLYREDLERPSWMQNRQYLHLYDHDNDVRSAVNQVVESFDRWLAKRPPAKE